MEPLAKNMVTRISSLYVSQLIVGLSRLHRASKLGNEPTTPRNHMSLLSPKNSGNTSPHVALAYSHPTVTRDAKNVQVGTAHRTPGQCQKQSTTTTAWLVDYSLNVCFTV